MNRWGKRYLVKLDKPEKFRWHQRNYTAKHTLTLDQKTYYIVKDLSGNKRERYMAFDRWTKRTGEMWCILGIDGRNLSTKLQPPGLVERLKIFSGNDGRLPVIFNYHQVKGKGGRVYLVTSWTEGEDLGSYLERVKAGDECARVGEKCVQKKINCLRKKEIGQRCEPRPTTWEVCSLMSGLAHGLYQLHRLNMVHGDLNPRNLILQQNPNRLVMIDFGSAWLVEHTIDRDPGDGSISKYAAPELSLNQPFVDMRSDQFSFGVLWYELLTLKLPYGGYGGGLVKHKPDKRDKVEQRYEPPSQAAMILGRDKYLLPREAWLLMDRIIGRCLELDPDKRYPKDRDLLDDVDELWRVLRPKRLSISNQQFLKILDGLYKIIYTVKKALRRIWYRITATVINRTKQ